MPGEDVVHDHEINNVLYNNGQYKMYNTPRENNCGMDDGDSACLLSHCFEPSRGVTEFSVNRVGVSQTPFDPGGVTVPMTSSLMSCQSRVSLHLSMMSRGNPLLV
jgi:hypothetical protein